MRRTLVPSCVLVALACLVAPSALAADAPARVVVKGSDTIGGELGPDLAKAFQAGHPGIAVTWEALGSKTAFVGLYDGSAQLGAASRPANADELKEAANRGVKLQEYVLGYDAIAVVVNPGNPVPSLGLEQLSKLFTGAVTNWKDVGGPDLPVVLVGRPSYSGTHAFFLEKAVRRGNAKGPEQFAASIKVLETNEEIVPLVAREPGAISYVGLGSVKPTVRTVPVSGGGAPVTAELSHVRDGSYPLYRGLYLYTLGAPTGAAATLLRFTLSPEGQALVAKHGFVQGGTSPDSVASGPEQAAPATPAVKPVRIHFKTSSAQLDEESRTALADLAAQAKRGGKVLVVGHADARGSEAVNQKVSLARAKIVGRELQRLGVARGSLQIKGVGAAEPAASNESRTGRDENRRVDVTLLGR